MQQMIFIADFIACSTCFGQYYAHHQELESIIQMVAACGIWCCKDAKSNLQVRQNLRFLALSVERRICCCRIRRVSWGLCMSVLGSIYGLEFGWFVFVVQVSRQWGGCWLCECGSDEQVYALKVNCTYLWFSGCRYGVELEVMCPVCRLLLYCFVLGRVGRG